MRKYRKQTLYILAGAASIALALWWLYRRNSTPSLTTQTLPQLPAPVAPTATVSGLEPEGGADIDGMTLDDGSMP